MVKIIFVSLPTKSQEMEENNILLLLDSGQVVHTKIPLGGIDRVKNSTMHGELAAQGFIENSLGGRRQ
jgi:hypothetical protein